jgi:sec-independent protein translocase protein TatB
MFDFSMAETSLTLVVALLLIGPKELPGVLRAMRNLSRKSQQVFKQFTDTIMEIEEVGGLKSEVSKLNDDIKRIVDLDGNLQETYDISDIMPEIEKAKNRNSTQIATEETKTEL